MRLQRCQWCWVFPQSSPVILWARLHPASHGWRIISPSCPPLSWRTPLVGRLCAWAQHRETAAAFTHAGPQIQQAQPPSITLSVFWVRSERETNWSSYLWMINYFLHLISPTADRRRLFILDVFWSWRESEDKRKFNSVLLGQRFPQTQSSLV